ncbi:hypothetical protein [Paenibacillus sp. MBLB4367]|uniref:hypothetical protein n=1 Tax=Paenibacillus sp. MBLB4367 TaxID=3384767 RepID=UPI0039082172
MLLEVIYHNIPKVKHIYKNTLDVELSVDIAIIEKAISIRHDIVHRSGKDIKGKMNEINFETLAQLIQMVRLFIKNINNQLQNKTITYS